MITSAKNYTKEKQKKQTKKATKTDRQNPRTNGKSKAIQTKSHKGAYTYTITKREKENIYICIFKKKKEESNQINKQIYQRLYTLNTKLS